MACGSDYCVLIQHNPNEGLKPQTVRRADSLRAVLIQHNPNEGLKQAGIRAGPGDVCVLIQHNPNEGLKPPLTIQALDSCVSAHSAQPERGIETSTRSADPAAYRWCSFSTTRTRD